MKDRRLNKVKQHFDVFFDDKKYKVLSFKINEAEGGISIKTKIRGQKFPWEGRFVIAIPSQNTMQELRIVFRTMSSDASIEHWEYTMKTEL